MPMNRHMHLGVSARARAETYSKNVFYFRTDISKKSASRNTYKYIANKHDVNIVRMLMDLHMHLTWAPGASFGTGAYLGLPSPQAKRDRLKNGEVRRLELYFVVF